MKSAELAKRESGAFLAPFLLSQRAADFLALTKPRLNLLVIVTAAVGYYLGADAPLDAMQLLGAIGGTALVAGGAAGLNQVYERDTDRVMWRTRSRPMASRRLSSAEAVTFSIALAVSGLTALSLTANLLATLLAALTLFSYTAVYTPMKRRTSFATIVGAVPGALPPMIGWVAARGALTAEAWALFAIVFVWQIPHFMAISWMYRDDFARAGFPLPSITRPDGTSTARQAVIFSMLLLPVSLAPFALGMAGLPYAAAAIAAGLALLALSISFAADRTDERARRLFFGSITYLPFLWIMLLAG